MRVPKDRKEELIKVCKDIEMKDKSFIWFEEDGGIVILSEDKDQAFKRGSWFIHKLDSRINYEVK